MRPDDLYPLVHTPGSLVYPRDSEYLELYAQLGKPLTLVKTDRTGEEDYTPLVVPPTATITD